jgi:hypothetical protein
VTASAVLCSAQLIRLLRDATGGVYTRKFEFAVTDALNRALDAEYMRLALGGTVG